MEHAHEVSSRTPASLLASTFPSSLEHNSYLPCWAMVFVPAGFYFSLIPIPFPNAI